MGQTWCFTPCALLYGLATGTLAFNAAALWGAVAGVCAVVGYYNFAYSLKSGSVSTNATIFRLSFAITVALAVLVLGEPLTAPKLAGLVLVVVAAWLLGVVPRGGTGGLGRENRSSIMRVLGATGVAGILSFVFEMGQRVGAAAILLV